MTQTHFILLNTPRRPLFTLVCIKAAQGSQPIYGARQNERYSQFRDIHTSQLFIGSFCFGDFLVAIGASKYVYSLLLVHKHTLHCSLVCLIHKRPVILVIWFETVSDQRLLKSSKLYSHHFFACPKAQTCCPILHTPKRPLFTLISHPEVQGSRIVR